jgi:cytochrome c oxidase cbb3-type subunit 1
MIDRSAIYGRTTIHAFAWLVVGNAAGVALALVLLAPSLGSMLGELTWGRWASVHLSVQLYGWCSVPMIALLWRAYVTSRQTGRLAPLALDAWSGALAFGVVSLLFGANSGKPFLEWSGASRWLFAGAMWLLALALAAELLAERRASAEAARTFAWRAKAAMLAALFCVPLVLALSAGRSVYPAINPHSGGATGWSLLGSTLGIVVIFIATPSVVGVRRMGSGRALAICWTALAASGTLFALVGHGDRSNHEPAQIAALATLLVWPPLLAWLYSQYEWPAASKLWLGAFGVWGAALVSTAFVMFLPGILERSKFTNVLVSHSHLAMAGLVTSFCMLLLTALDESGRASRAAGDRATFWLWQAAFVAHVAALAIAGLREGAEPGLAFGPSSVIDAAYAVRAAAGAAMLVISMIWLARACGAGEEALDA